MTVKLNISQNINMFKSHKKLFNPIMYKFVPLRISSDNSIVALVKGKYRKIYKGYSDQLFCFDETPHYDEKYISIIKKNVYYDDLEDLLNLFVSVQKKN